MSSVVPTYIVPPPGLNFLNSIQACYTFVLICLPLTSILVPILLLIFFFSTPASRKTLLFALNTLIVLLGIAEGLLSTIVQAREASIIILHPQHPVSDSLFLAYIGISVYTPIIVDSILILRLSAVYPASITPRANRLSILSVPLLCTVARIACVTLFVHRWAILGYQSSAVMAGNIIWPQNPLIIADWSIQLFGNLYCSTLFLYRLQGHKAFSSRMYRHQSIASRLRAVFYIAGSNFVFPSILNIFQLIYIIHDRSVVHGAIVLVVNNYVSIIGVVFCTLWCASDTWKGMQLGQPSKVPKTCDAEAVFRQSVITLSGIAPNINLTPTDPWGSQPFTHIPGPGIRPFLHSHVYRGDRKNNTNTGPTSDEYIHNMTLNPTAGDADADVSAESHSPITPHDVRVIIDSGKQKRGPRWKAALTSSSGSHPRNRHSHSDPDAMSSFAEFDMDIGLDFATPTPLPSHRRNQRRSHSLSDFADYRGREHPPHQDIGERNVRLADESRGRLRPFSEQDRHPSPFINNVRPLVSRAHRPLFLDWSDAEPGGRCTPSWDGYSLEEP